MGAALAVTLLVPWPAAAQETGRLFTPGPNFLTPAQQMTFKLQNLYRSPLALAVAVLAANGTLSYYQKVTVQPLSILDVLVAVACAPCVPIVFLPDGQLGPSHYRLPLQLNVFLKTNTTTTPVSQMPSDLWLVFFGAALGATSIDFGPKFDKDDGCRSWSPGPVHLPASNGYFFATNFGKVPVEAETGCINTAGQPVQGCQKTTTIQPLHTALIQLAGALQMLPFINARPGTLGLNFAVPQFTTPLDSIPHAQMTRTPEGAQMANNYNCVRLSPLSWTEPTRTP